MALALEWRIVVSPQYQVAKLCLHLLEEISITSIRKLRLQIQFIQLLRLLLQEDLTGFETGTCSEDEFAAVHRTMLLMKEQGGGRDAMSQVMERVGEILLALSTRERANDRESLHGFPPKVQ